MALVEDGALLGSRQVNMGNSGLDTLEQGVQGASPTNVPMSHLCRPFGLRRCALSLWTPEAGVA